MYKLLNSKIFKIILIILLCALALISILKGTINGLEEKPIDFLHKYFVTAAQGISYNGPQFPHTMLLIFPLGFLSYRNAQIVWLILQFIFTGILIFGLSKTWLKNLNKFEFIVLILLMLAGAPWRTNLSNLQYTLCSFSMFIMGIYYMEKEKDITSGFFLSLSILKIQLILPLFAYFIVKKKIKPLIFFGLFQLIALLFSWVWFKDIYAITFGKTKAILRHAGSSHFIDIPNIINNPVISLCFSLLVLAIIIIVSFKVSKFDKDETHNLYFCWLLLFSLIAFYHRIYDYFMIIIPISIIYKQLLDKKTLLLKLLFLSSTLTLIFINFIETITKTYSATLIAFFYYIFLILLSIYLFLIIAAQRNLNSKNL